MVNNETSSANQSSSIKERIDNYLKEFDWLPETTTEKDGEYTISLLAHLDIKNVTIDIKFSENGHWIYFSAIFLPIIKTNHMEIYKKLLNINYTTTLTKFGMSNDGQIYALIELALKTLDYSEFTAALRRLSNDINQYFIPIAALMNTENEE